MKKLLIALSCALGLAAPAAASAETAIGLGAQAMIGGPSGAALTFDVGLLHFDAILGFVIVDEDDDAVLFGARAWYSVHQTGRSDFSVGGGLGVISGNGLGSGNGSNNDADFFLEGGGKARIFVVPNVALTGTVGLAIEFIDDNNGMNDSDYVIIAGGQTVSGGALGITGGFGFTYYFH